MKVGKGVLGVERYRLRHALAGSWGRAEGVWARTAIQTNYV